MRAFWAAALTAAAQIAMAADYPPPPGPYSPRAAGSAAPGAMLQPAARAPEPARRGAPPSTFRDPVKHPLAPPPAATAATAPAVPVAEPAAASPRPAPAPEPGGYAYARPAMPPAPPATPAWVRERRAAAWRPAPPAPGYAAGAPPVFRAYQPAAAEPAAPAPPAPQQRATTNRIAPDAKPDVRSQRMEPPQRPDWANAFGSYTRAEPGRQDPRFRPPELLGTP